jgi:hypothetical protein
MNAPQAIGIVALLLVIAALGYAVFSEPAVITPGDPRTGAERISDLEVHVPPIGDFEREFNVNLENPFVPADAREREKQEVSRMRNPGRAATPRSQPPPVVPLPVEPEFPPLSSRDTGAPECLGIVRKGGQAVLVARLPGQNQVNLDIGASLGGWTLREIGIGQVRFTDPAGMPHDLPVGMLNLSTTAPASGSDPTTQPSIPRAEGLLRPGSGSQPPPPDAAPGMQPRPAPEIAVPRPKPK